MTAGDTADTGDLSRVAWRMARKPESVPEGRHTIAALVRKTLGYGDASERAELCASELLTNALEHGAGPEIEIVVTVTEDAVRVTVHDDGGTGRIAAPGHDDLTGRRVDNGRGLFIVDAMADRWQAVQPRRRGTTVWFEIKLPGRGPAGGAV